MDQLRKKVAVLRFEGPRFGDHGLDVDVLPEVITYKRILQETAKEIWRRRNPGRQRLPRNFETQTSLKFFEIEPGSAAVPLYRELAPGQLSLLEHEVDEAAFLLEDAIAHAQADYKIPPDNLPRSVVPLFDQFGQTLMPEESIVISSRLGSLGARYDQTAKRLIRLWASQAYPDDVDLTGEVRGTELDGQKFVLRLDNGRKVSGRFNADQEPLILEALSTHLSRRLRVIGVGQFGDDGNLEQIVQVNEATLLSPEPEPSDDIPIWERIISLGKSEPEETWAVVPNDLAERADFYLYGRKDKR
ncbi:MAG: hypothetical protein JO051_16580 [Acidobacteriaceae bacterium]|nr:hypothetical protein [Acidobacteriaceae bacterium]